MREKIPARPVCLLACFAWLAGAAWCQQTRGSIVGLVTDPSGSAVPGVPVTLTNERTGITASTTTGTTGEYTFVNLDPGSYAVAVEAPGFKKGVVQRITLYVAQASRVDLVLEVGEVTTSVEVQAAIPVVQSERSSVGSVVDGTQIVSMPLNGRASIYSLMALAPGVARAGINPMIAGGSWYGSANMTVDGAANIDVGNERILPLAPSLESIAEFSVIGNGASAEYGRGGAQVVVATRSGTNEFHGSLFAFNRNRVTAAKNAFATGLPKPKFNRNEFGGSLGGPVIRNKLFFFGVYEGLRQRVASTVVTAMPTAALRRGDFGGLAPIRDPWGNTPFPNNQVPADRIAPAAAELMKFASDPNTATTAPAGLGNNFTANIPTREFNDRYTVRADYQLTPRDNFMARYFQVDNGPYEAAAGGTDKFGNWGGFGTATKNVTGSYSRVLSPRLISESRFGFAHTRYFRTTQNNTFDPSKIIPGLITPAEGLGGLPTVSITGFRGFFDQPGSGDRQRSYEVLQTVNWTRNKHTVKAGFEFQRASSRNWQNPPPYRGQFNFDGRYSGHAFADFLLGAPSLTGRVSKNVLAEPLNSRYAAFLQDDWNLSRKLTLNLGLRYEYAGLFTNGQGDMSNFYPDLGKLVVIDGTPDARLMAALPVVMGQDAGIGRGNWLNRDRNNWAPRVGFAYRPFGNTRFVVRSSYGIYYNVIPGYTFFGFVLNPPFRLSETFEPGAGTTPSLTLANAFPGAGAVAGNPSLTAFSRDRRTPYHQQWNFTLEGEVLPNTALRASYVGNKGTHLERQFPLNDPAPAPGALQPRRPYQPFGSITYYESGRDSILHQLQLSAIRRFAQGLSFQVEYQFSRALGEQVYGLAPMDNRNTRLDRGNLDFIRRHVTRANYVYDLPFGKGKRWLGSVSGAADKLLSGWQLTGILAFGSGEPFSVTFTSQVLGWPSSRADIVGDPGLPDRSTARWFNPAAFAVPAPFTYGNSARNLLFGPGYFDWDVGIFKNTAIGERMMLEFRGEFFNFLNHANFGLPAANISVPSTVGRISSAGDPRTIQFGMRLRF